MGAVPQRASDYELFIAPLRSAQDVEGLIRQLEDQGQVELAGSFRSAVEELATDAFDAGADLVSYH